MKFNPDAKLDTSQVKDKRPKVQTTTGTSRNLTVPKKVHKVPKNQDPVPKKNPGLEAQAKAKRNQGTRAKSTGKAQRAQ